MYEDVTTRLDQEEYRGLALLCSQDIRNPGQVMRWLLLKELSRRSMLSPEREESLRAEESQGGGL